MDLRSIINNEAGDSSKQTTPVTPVQPPPQRAFREYNHPSHASPRKHLSQDYGPHPGPGPYASPTTYGRPPPPPPIQAPPQNDLRSPARSYSVQSPYQHTPSSTVIVNQYPVPPGHQTPLSPAQHHQYPSSFQQRENYPQSNPPPHLQHQGSHNQVSPAPQTPPIGMPGAPHHYLQHQRSHSSVSTATPTSAQSQQTYYNPFPQDSPVSASHFPPGQLPQHQRQQSYPSQPGTPLGPPLSQRQSSAGFTQPTSPYQQRGVSSGPFAIFQQTSPAPPVPASIPRLPSTPNASSDPQRASVASEPQRTSQSERERSLSVSPKTRLPSQPRGDIQPLPQQIQQQQTENGYNLSKRKMEDREVSVEEPRLVNQPQATKSQVNGDHQNSPIPILSPKQPPKKRIRYTEPPIWAQSVRSRNTFDKIRKVNGKQPTVVKTETNGNRQASPAATRVGGQMDSSDPSILLGPWEKSITGKKPVEQMTKQIADFLFLHVVSRNDLGELASRGVEVEIEAKLGQLINKDTNERFYLPVNSECILTDSARVGFKSSMTESQHQGLNKFLNEKVTEAHPENPNAGGRVQIVYLHRRENDKFYELPPSMYSTLPAAVRERLNPRHTVKVRVTHDQKTNQILAKIVKARLVDLDIFMPQEPLDCRISINFEMRYDGDMEEVIAQGSGERIADRSKDRLSYTQGHYQVDLTQVTQVHSVNGVNRLEKEHELEIEISTAAVREQGRRAMASEPNEYFSLVEGMIDNVRVLARNVPLQ